MLIIINKNKMCVRNYVWKYYQDKYNLKHTNIKSIYLFKYKKQTNNVLL